MRGGGDRAPRVDRSGDGGDGSPMSADDGKPMTEDVALELRAGGVLWLTFQRPKARNAMTFEMYDALERTARRANEDAAVTALVVTGASGAFVAGTGLAQCAGFKTA